MGEHVGLRGRAWFEALTGQQGSMPGDPGSILAARADTGRGAALFLCVAPNPQSRFPCVRDGQVGLEEAFALATHVRDAIAADRDKPRSQKLPIIAIVDVKSQAYGRREETAGIFLAAAASADAYASARVAGHPVIAFVAGQAFSGGFLTHGYQANRILALDDPGVVIHAMHKEAAARITRRTVQDIERLGREIPPMSYDVRDYARLGILSQLLHVEDPMHPTQPEVQQIRQALQDAIDDARGGNVDLRGRLESPEAKKTRQAGIHARLLMEEQWGEEMVNE